MKKHYLILSLLAATTLVSAQTIPVNWTSFDAIGHTAAGQMELVVVSGSQVRLAAPTTSALSTANFSTAPLSDSQAILEYAESADFTSSFSHPVTGLMLYMEGWRTIDLAFDQSFTILSGLTVTGNTLAAPGGFSSGINRFTRPVSTLALNNPTGSDSRQALTFAVIPQATTAAIAGLKKNQDKTLFSHLAWYCHRHLRRRQGQGEGRFEQRQKCKGRRKLED